MATAPQRLKHIGKFRPSADSASMPARADMFKAGDGREGVRKALAEAAPSPVTNESKVDHPPDTIKPAKNVNELQGQIGQLIAAFQSSERRDPDVNDRAFWNAYGKLIDAYQRSASNYEPPAWDGKPTVLRKVVA